MENEVRQIQLKCLEILNIVDAICRKHQIAYSLCGGSVVGAHLYGGCLPWDDDIDLMMTRENYNRFVNVVLSELPPGFSVHNYQLTDDFAATFTKIMNDNTTVVQQDGTVSGVFLDITVYDKVPDGWRMQIDTFFWKLSQIVMVGKVRPENAKAMLRNFALSTFLHDRRAYLRFFQRVAERLGNVKNYSYAELFGAYCNTKKFDSAIFENYAEIEFEGRAYMIVRDYIKYLITRYERTDFREPEEKQVSPHYRYVNFELPYQGYLGGVQHGNN